MMSLMDEACGNDMREMADDARYAVMLLGVISTKWAFAAFKSSFRCVTDSLEVDFPGVKI